MNLNKFGLYLPFPKGMSFGGGGGGGGGSGDTSVSYVFRYANSGTGDIGNISSWKVRTGTVISAATRLPASSDDVFLYGEVTSDSSGGHFTAKGSVKSVTIYTAGHAFPDYYTFNGVMYVYGNPFSGVYNGIHYVNGLKAIFHFNDTASGASANNDLSDPLNYWFDAAWTIPAGTVPALNDDVIIDSIVYNDSTGIGVVGFNSVTVSSTGLVTTNIPITTASFTNNSQFTGGFAEHYYTNGVFDTSINGLYFDSHPPTGYALFVNGVTNSFFTGGYNGTYYTLGIADTTFTGTVYDYGNGESLFYVNGTALSGGSYGTHYTNGIPDSFTGVDCDYGTGESLFYIGGQQTSLDSYGNGDWNGSHYQNGSIFTDGYDYNNGVYYIGGQQTSLDSYGNGIWNSGIYSVGSLVGVALSLLPTTAQVQSGVTYGNGLTGTLATETPIPQEWDNYAYYGQGAVVAYDDSLWLLASIGGWTVGGRPDLGYGWQKLFTGGGSTGAPASPINIAQLIGLPAFIQL
jgi:hypothetical protein